MTSPHAWLLVVNAAATFFVVGVIWFVQTVHCPWVRTLAWTARGMVVCALLVVPR